MDDFQPLRFVFSSFLREIQAIENLAKRRFLDASATDVFRRLKEQLNQLQTHGGQRPTLWMVNQDAPLRTVETYEYEQGERRGPRGVVGEICWCWQLRNCQGRGRPTEFEVHGNASILLRIRESEGAMTEIARWRIECGASDSPGCFFHTQIFGDENDTLFPKNVPVPRLPTLFVTPMSAIEFFLGELFQDAWPKQLVGNKSDLAFWTRNQKTRLKQLLTWKLRQVEACDSGSPWLALKRAKPRQGDVLFAEEN